MGEFLKHVRDRPIERAATHEFTRGVCGFPLPEAERIESVQPRSQLVLG